MQLWKLYLNTNLLNCEHLGLSDYEMLGRNSVFYTCVSDAHHSTSWLDQDICSSNMHNVIGSIYVVDKLPSSDHLPLDVIFSMTIVDKARHGSKQLIRKAEAPCHLTEMSPHG